MTVLIYSITLILLKLNFSASTKEFALKIQPENEITVDAGSDFELICQGNQNNIRFFTPEIPKIYDDYTKWTTSENSAITIRDTEYLFAKKLVIHNVTGFHTGFYSCGYLFSVKKQTYVYVKDDKNICFIDHGLKMQKIDMYSEGAIPCKVTSTDVLIELYSISKNKQYRKKVHLNETGENGSVYVYNKREGFKTDDTRTEKTTEYLCKCSRGSHISYLRYWTKTEPIESLIPKPKLRSVNEINVKGQRLELECKVEKIQLYSFRWRTPTNSSHPNTLQIITNSSDNTIFQRLIINETTSKDQGIYYCTVFDDSDDNTNHIDVTIYDPHVYFIRLNQQKFVYNVDSSQGETFAQWVLKWEGFPNTTLTWIKNGNETIPLKTSSSQFITNSSPNTVSLKIKSISDSDFNSSYTLYARNNFTEKSLTLFVNSTGKPSATIDISERRFHWSQVRCKVVAYPKPKISWYFKACLNSTSRFQIIQPVSETENLGYTISYVEVNSSLSGLLKCHAKNALGQVEVTQEMVSLENNSTLQILGLDGTLAFPTESGEKIEAVIGETVKIACDFKLGSNPSEKPIIKWNTPSDTVFGVPVDSYYKIEETDFIYRIRSTLTVLYADRFDNSIFSCEASLPNTTNCIKKIVQVIVADGYAARIVDKENKPCKNFGNILGQNFNLHCYTSGFPTPIIQWFKDNATINPSNRIQLLNRNQTIFFQNMTSKDAGTYACKAFNKFGIDEMEVKLTVDDSSLKWIILIVVFLVALIALFSYIIIKKHSQKKFRERLKLINLENFEKGALENLNPLSTIEEQANLLPYDVKWEFPVENLKIGQQLGSGAFGVVMKGEAKGIIAGEASTIVAVKMINREIDVRCFEALASELKIMAHLGKHINIVNLLGACTRNIFKRKLYIIVEYCSFGNLHHHLLHHQENFINQLDTKTGWFDFSIGKLVCSKDGSSCENQEYFQNYICSKDLLVWAFQVCRGMEYLVSRRILHGDLAARNILLTDDNVVKICDFGLAKSMNYQDTYRKIKDTPLPVKWLAIESLTHRIFSTQSDVWSFGIVLWEFFTLGQTPYPEIEFGEDLCNKLLKGYRMKCPDLAPKQIHDLMLYCWEALPKQRPSFTELVQRIGSMIDDSDREHYIIMNSPYEIMNAQVLENQTDYLALATEPNYENLTSPDCYVDLLKPVETTVKK